MSASLMSRAVGIPEGPKTRSARVAVEGSCDFAHHHPQQDEAKVAVATLCAHGEAERPVADDGEEFVLRAVHAKVKVVGIARQAGGVLEQMSHCNRGPGIRCVGKVRCQWGIEPHAAVVYEHQHRHHCEGLPNRARLEDGARCHRNPMLEIGEAVALGEDDLAVAHDRHRDAGHLLVVHHPCDVGIDAVDLLSKGLLSREGR